MHTVTSPLALTNLQPDNVAAAPVRLRSAGTARTAGTEGGGLTAVAAGQNAQTAAQTAATDQTEETGETVPSPDETNGVAQESFASAFEQEIANLPTGMPRKKEGRTRSVPDQQPDATAVAVPTAILAGNDPLLPLRFAIIPAAAAETSKASSVSGGADSLQPALPLHFEMDTEEAAATATDTVTDTKAALQAASTLTAAIAVPVAAPAPEATVARATPAALDSLTLPRAVEDTVSDGQVRVAAEAGAVPAAKGETAFAVRLNADMPAAVSNATADTTANATAEVTAAASAQTDMADTQQRQSQSGQEQAGQQQQMLRRQAPLPAARMSPAGRSTPFTVASTSAHTSASTTASDTVATASTAASTGTAEIAASVAGIEVGDAASGKPAASFRTAPATEQAAATRSTAGLTAAATARTTANGTGDVKAGATNGTAAQAGEPTATRRGTERAGAETAERTAVRDTVTTAETASTAASETAAPRTAETANTATVATAAPAAATHTAPRQSVEAPAAPATPAVAIPEEQVSTGQAKHIDLQISAPGEQRVQVRVMDHAGEVRVSVQTADETLGRTLRENLGDLSSRLTESGYRTETWQPAASANSQFSGRRDSQETNAWDQQRGGSQQDSGQRQDQQRQEDSRQRPEWLEELENSLASRQTGRNATA